MSGTLTILARAKINLGLRIACRRDDGYHEIDTIFQSIDLYDRLVIEVYPSSRPRIRTSSDSPYAPGGPRNLAHRAAELLLSAAGASAAVSIHMEKHIPVSSGMGGGSADAAATLLGLGRLLGYRGDLLSLARRLGADVPFFLSGGTQRGSGTGSDLCTITAGRGFLQAGLLVVKPPLAVSTPWAYSAWDGKSSPVDGVRADVLALQRGDVRSLIMNNDLERAVVSAHPRLAEIREALDRAGAAASTMSGSGPTFFGLFEDENSARKARAEVKKDCPGMWIASTRPYGGPAVEIVSEEGFKCR